MEIATKSKELIALGLAVISSNKTSIIKHVKRAFELGITKDEILRVISVLAKNKSNLYSIIELTSAINNEENKRAKRISVNDDARE